MGRIDPGHPKSSGSTRKPEVKRPQHPDDRMWSFAFRYFRQIERFGLSTCDSAWHVALLDRLTQLSGERIERVIADPGYSQQTRFHQIDWNAINCPLTRADLKWVDSTYLESPDDYPMLQMFVSLANGRFHGFFDENWVFQVVLLDPLHNLQPSKAFGYKVDPCSPIHSKYYSLEHGVRDARAIAKCTVRDCEVIRRIDQLPWVPGPEDSITLRLERSVIDRLDHAVTNGKVANFEQVFEFGLDYITE